MSQFLQYPEWYVGTSSYIGASTSQTYFSTIVTQMACRNVMDRTPVLKGADIVEALLLFLSVDSKYL